MSTPRNRRAAIAITIVSVGVPLLLDTLLGYFSSSTLAPSIDAVRYSMFMGLGLAITAVPILGRILRQYGLTHTEVGVVAISAAAINDVIGWLLLSIVSAYAGSQLSGAHVLFQVAGLTAFVLVLWFLLRPAVTRLMARFPVVSGELNLNFMAIIICLIFVLGLCTYQLGIFAIFGGFAGGLLFHHSKTFVEAWAPGRLIHAGVLPAGILHLHWSLRTNVLGLSSATDWQWLAVIPGGDNPGKIVPVYFMGRACGFREITQRVKHARRIDEHSRPDGTFASASLSGLIPQNVFTMLVIMAVATTLMADPAC